MSTNAGCQAIAAPIGDEPIIVAALYRFTPLGDVTAYCAPLARLACGLGIKGTLLLASEGINGTIAGSTVAIDRMIAAIRALPGCEGLDVKFSRAASMPFGRLKVRLKQEIVTMGVAGIDPLRSVGTYVDPADWNALISDPETLLVDTRNAYEIGIGTFEGAVDPGTRSFREFPDWIARRLREGERPRRIAMFCTGGIRCEKATAYVRQLGIEEVYHLKGGILKYLEEVPEGDSLWRGECYVFDERVSVGHGLSLGSHKLCRRCGNPIACVDGNGGGFAEGCCPACED